MKKGKLFAFSFGAFAMAFGAVTSLTNAKTVPAKAATMKTFYLDCTTYDWDTYDSICLHMWGSGIGDKYYQANKAGDNYWSVTVDIDGFSGCEFYKCNRVWENNGGADNLYNKQSWLGFPSDNFYYTVVSDSYGNDNCNWTAPVAWYLTGDSSATLSASKFDSDGLQYYATSVPLNENDVIEFANGSLTTGYADLRDAGNGQTAKEKGLVVDDGNGKVKVTKSGNYDIYVNCITGKVWMQSDAATDADHWAQDFLANGCTEADTGTKAKWGEFESSFFGLTQGAQNLLKNEAHAEYDEVVSGNVALAIQRYDYVLKLYGRNDANSDSYGYKDFMGRVDAGKVQLAPNRASILEDIVGPNTGTFVATMLALTAFSAASVFFLLKKRKEN